jgi:hypothetical protein
MECRAFVFNLKCILYFDKAPIHLTLALSRGEGNYRNGSTASINITYRIQNEIS